MGIFNLIIIEPYNIIFKGKVKRLLVKTIEGEFSVLAGFENFITTTISSKIEILMENNEILSLIVAEGFLRVSGESVVLCTNIIN